jgi:serine/threonine protein kinase
MGRVFRAHDSKLKRDVAVKILPEPFSGDADRLMRFRREAEALASLNHSNIAGIHDVLEIDGSRFLVLELVEGETLAQHIARGPLPVQEAIDIAKQIAEALEAAHERGIVHRDLKPANVKITPDGKVKVLDFGLAKVRSDAVGAAAEQSNSPTLVSGTMSGVIMGTALYMSPEQARGKSVDRSADVWAFACVLYEMLTGQKAFDGETVTDVFGAIVKTDPDWNALPAAVPLHVRRLLQRCLMKDRRRRLRDMGAALLELTEPSEPPVDQKVHTQRWAWAVMVLLAAGLGSALFLIFRPTPMPPEFRLEVSTPDAISSDAVHFALSPDGQKVVFSATTEGRTRLWLRSLDSTTAKTLQNTEDANYPFWSPDSRSIGFFADGKLKRIDLSGGPAQVLADAPSNRGGTWGPNGFIFFAPVSSGSISRVSDRGGDPTPVTKTEPGRQAGHRHPQFLPDGRHFLFYAQGSPDARGIYVASADGSSTQRLVDADSAAVYSAGYLLLVRQATIFAVSFDLKSLSVKGDPIPVADQVASDGANRAALSASLTGSWMYRTGGAANQRQFVWFDRAGKEIAKVGLPDPGNLNGGELSPDGKHIAVGRTVNGNNDIWLLEIQRGILSPLTTNPAQENYPTWSPDGLRIVFNSSRSGSFDLYEKLVSGIGNEQLVVASPLGKQAADWSPDGSVLLYGTNVDIMAVPMTGDRKTFPVVQTDAAESLPQFSPDGKWIAYQSNESGQFEIYAQPFPGPGPKVRISTNGGAQVRWPRSGKELFYISLDGRLMAAPIRFDSKANTIEPSLPTPLFRPRMAFGVVNSQRQQYMVSPDGQRFLINTPVGDASIAPITFVQNWSPAAVK